MSNENKTQQPRGSGSPALVEWHRGPSYDGEGTAGGDRWRDGDHLLVIVNLACGAKEVMSVTVNCDAIADAVDESRSVKGAVAMIKRTESPDHYYGHNEHGPMWTTSPMHAAPVSVTEVQDVLNELSVKCPNVWAVIYPHNASVEQPAPTQNDEN